MDSLWTKTAQLPKFEALKKDISTDVLIIGGGMAGLLCVWKLKQAGIDCLLVEQDRLCSGITKNTTAKITVVIMLSIFLAFSFCSVESAIFALYILNYSPSSSSFLRLTTGF